MFTNTSWAEKETAAAIIAYAVAYGGFAQMVAGVLEVGSCGRLLLLSTG
jgi:succinate-acetate transporter protein